MRLAYLIAGAGGMYCGSCLRDNRLAATLIAAGRDVVLMPLYTPIRTDERDVSQSRVLYGGVNVYLQQQSRIFRALPGWATRFLDSPGLLRRIMRVAGDTHPKWLGPLTVSMLKGQRGAQHKELERLVSELRTVAPDVVCLPNLMFAGVAERIKAVLGIPVLCSLSGEDIFLDELPDRYRTEAMALIRAGSEHIDAFVAPTEYFAAFAAEHFGLPRDRVHVAGMGVGFDDVTTQDVNMRNVKTSTFETPTAMARDVASSTRSDDPFTIGYLARICPEKGLHNLVDAFVRLREAGRDCQLRAAGYLGKRSRSYLDSVRATLREQGVADDFEYVGEVDHHDKQAFLRSLHVCAVPTNYHEAKGLYVLEAMACGVPVVQPRHGSFPEILGATGGGLLYDPNHPDGLVEALTSMMDDSAMRGRMATAGPAGVAEHYSNEAMADRMWAVCERHVDGTDGL